ncbi:hypothetical protein GGR58DRAFT_309998 [Xylaria digitata]|nr:hypothetical protein GGR58DRAFT_309998 [Xylaria digitata]
MMGSNALQCHACDRCFTRLEHLQRHLLSHTEARAFLCSFCPTRFNRRDALVRHWRTCKERLNSGQAIPTLSRQKRGRKQNACDRCVQKRRRCSQSFPCDGCIELGQECTFLRFLPSAANESRLDTSSANVDECAISSSAPSAPDSVPGTDASFPAGILWDGSVDQTSQTGEGIDTSTHQVVSREDQSLEFPGVDSSLEVLPPAPNCLALELKYWPAAVRWNIDIMSTFGFSFGSYTRPKLSFLARFTSTDGIGDSFECGDPEQRKQFMSLLSQGQLRGHGIDGQATDALMPRAIPFELDIGLDISQVQAPILFAQTCDTPGNPNLMGNMFASNDAPHTDKFQDWLVGDLSSRTQEIVSGIQDVVHNKPRKSPIKITWSPSREMLCYRFFSPSNLERFLAAFWAMWYPNWPVFHKPTFFAAQKPGTLLAAMAIIGASLTSEDTDRDQAMVWADAVEEWVFSDDTFCESSIPRTDDEFEEVQIETRLNSLRAAYAVVLFLSWEGITEQKKRARRIRYSQVIAVARSLQFSAAIHDDLDTYICSRDQLRSWKSFALREELIRTLLYVFMLDCGYLIFNNSQPRMAALELECQLACPEVCFQAETLESWLQHITIWSNTQVGRRQPLVSNVIEIMMRARPSKEDWAMLQQMSVLNFFLIGNGKLFQEPSIYSWLSIVLVLLEKKRKASAHNRLVFHNLIFHHQCGPAPYTEVPSISQYLMNWNTLWSTCQQVNNLIEPHPTDPRDAWKRCGFMRFAQEFWGLAYIIYKQPMYIQNLQRNGSQGRSGSLRKAFLKNFDDSSMRQVHELIMRFQDLSLLEDLVVT